MNIINCGICEKPFIKRSKDVCPECLRKEDEIQEKIFQFLKENPVATIQEISEATNINFKYINKLIKDGRVKTITVCERCGKEIKDTKNKKYCELCAKDIYGNILKNTKTPGNSLRANKQVTRKYGLGASN
ncbi:MAG: winged helix-turn-helix transcriptional regulator [Cyanobacteriota bacterium]